MERNVTIHFTNYLKHAACSASPNRGLTLIEIQRWEDDGGAALVEATPRHRAAEHHHDDVGEYAAAE
jgi:hypothetical protein